MQNELRRQRAAILARLETAERLVIGMGRTFASSVVCSMNGQVIVSPLPAISTVFPGFSSLMSHDIDCPKIEIARLRP